jgi:alginate O-acetyltransferase complex protein AlgI
MAVGLARMFGFHFPENFAQPYTAHNVTDFWRRWHMTLTRWFRDYLYIPLGGNRRGPSRTYANRGLVFLLCGLWHGAAWRFVIWGAYHGSLLVAERVLDQRFGIRPRGIPGSVMTFVLITIGWVFFRSTSIGGAVSFIGTMFGVGASSTTAYPLTDALTVATVSYLLVAAALAFIPEAFAAQTRGDVRYSLAKGVVALVVLFFGIAYISESTFKPFVDFRF